MIAIIVQGGGTWEESELSTQTPHDLRLKRNHDKVLMTRREADG